MASFFAFLHPPPLPLPKTPKNQEFEKMKKIAEDIIILHMRTINHNHMVCGSSDMEWDEQNFLPFGSFFSLLPQQPTKSIFWNNEKSFWRWIILHMCS